MGLRLTWVPAALRERAWVQRPDAPYLSLTREDIDCLRGDWLTDNNISFWEEYLEQEALANYSSKVILLRPSMVFLLKSTPDPHTLVSALPNFKYATHIFLPINDCRNPEIPEGGSHWSLMVVGIVDRVAFHYDSLSAANVVEAIMVYEKLQKLLGFPLKFLNLEDTPLQTNSSDCGVHVCWSVRYLLVKRLLTVDKDKAVDMSLGGKRIDATAMRKEMLKICEALRKKASRRLEPAPSIPTIASSSGKRKKRTLRRDRQGTMLKEMPAMVSPDSNESSCVLC
ncbi:hypothetical protein RUND412_004366 [Rhizina undulata]